MARWFALAALLLVMGVAMPEARAGDRDDCISHSVAACTRLAEQGDVVAQFKLGNMYEHGISVPEDYAAAMRWYRKAADQGLAAAQDRLGILYSNGYVLPVDIVKSTYWFRKAAEQGLASAQTDLGLRYSTGHGVPKDYVQALVWFSLAAAQGDTTANAAGAMVAERMTQAQIDQAQALAAAWKPTKPTTGQ